MSNKISWTDQTWNPVTGCSHAKTPGCDNCYARRMSKRLAGRAGYPPAPDNFKVTLHPDRLGQPLRWRKPRRVFVCSMSDLFHKDVPEEYLNDIFSIMLMLPQHRFQILTKRPERMLKYLTADFRRRKVWEAMKDNFYRFGEHCGTPMNYGDVIWPMRHVWLGVTAENQKAADERVPLLLQTPAAVRFVSCEPLLSKINLGFWCLECSQYYHYNEFFYTEGDCSTEDCQGGYNQQFEELNLCITGGETGPGARPMHPNWARSLRDQCQAAGVAYHFKQHGEWLGFERKGLPGHGYYYDATGERLAISDIIDRPHEIRGDHGLVRIGNKRAGHLLDGIEWREMPEV